MVQSLRFMCRFLSFSFGSLSTSSAEILISIHRSMTMMSISLPSRAFVSITRITMGVDKAGEAEIKRERGRDIVGKSAAK